MFPLAHIYVATKITEEESDLLVLGSVIPDIDWVSQGRVKTGFHESPGEFLDFIKIKYPDCLDLALGVKLHSPGSKGVDFYSDDEETGYAKVNGRKIIKLVADVLSIEEGQQALVLSHNFIEAAIDLLLAQKFPTLKKTYQQAISSDAKQKAAIVISDYIGKDVSLVDSEIGKLFDFFSPDNVSSIMKVCFNAVVPFLEKTLGRKLDNERILDILKESEDLVNDSYLSFLDETVKKIKVDLKL